MSASSGMTPFRSINEANSFRHIFNYEHKCTDGLVEVGQQ